MFDDLRNRRHRQMRRCWNERIGRQVDAGANGAIIVAVVAGLLLAKRRFGGVSFRAKCRGGGINPSDRVEMNVTERKAKLNRQRDQRQPTANPSVVKPAHGAHCQRRKGQIPRQRTVTSWQGGRQGRTIQRREVLSLRLGKAFRSPIERQYYLRHCLRRMIICGPCFANPPAGLDCRAADRSRTCWRSSRSWKSCRLWRPAPPGSPAPRPFPRRRRWRRPARCSLEVRAPRPSTFAHAYR